MSLHPPTLRDIPSWGRLSRTISSGILEVPDNDHSSRLDATLGTPTFHHLAQESEFLSANVPNFDEIALELPLKEGPDIDPQTTFIFQLLKWIIAHGKPAILEKDRAEQAAIEIQHALDNLRETTQSELAKRKLMNTELRIQAHELKDKLSEKRKDITILKKELERIRGNDAEADLANRETAEVIDQLHESEAGNARLRRENHDLQDELDGLRKSWDELSEAYHSVTRERDTVTRKLECNQALAAEMEEGHQAKMILLNETLQTVVESRQKLVEKLSKLQREQETLKEASVMEQFDENFQLSKQITKRIVTDFQLSQSTMNLSVMSNSDDEDIGFVLLQSEVDEYADSDDAWLSESFSEDYGSDSPEEVFRSESIHTSVTPLPKIEPELEEIKTSIEVESAPKAREQLQSESLSIEVDAIVESIPEFEAVMTSTSVDAFSEDFSSSTISTGVERLLPELRAESWSMEVNVTKDVEEFEATRISTSVDRVSRDLEIAITSNTSIASVKRPIIPRPKRVIPKPKSPETLTIPELRHIEVDSKSPETPQSFELRDEIDHSGKKFGNLLSIFSNLETKNPGAPKGQLKHKQSKVFGRKWMGERTGTKRVAIGSKRETSDTIRTVRTKIRTLKPRMKGYMKKNSANYFFCLDGLPSQTNVDRLEDESLKDRTNDRLVPCLFFFESEAKYRDFIMKHGGLHVREAPFQKAFAENVLGIIALEGKDVEMDDDVESLFLSIVGGGASETFECASVEKRDEWLAKIAKLIQKRRGVDEKGRSRRDIDLPRRDSDSMMLID